jgi:uncharacterized iron-regulated membrane protein
VQRLLVSLILILAFLLGVVALWLAHEEWGSYEHGVPYPPRRVSGESLSGPRGILSLQEIVRRLRLPAGSRLLEVEREEEHGHLYYEIELLMPGGHVQELLVDPHTAEVIGVEVEEEEAHETAAGGG